MKALSNAALNKSKLHFHFTAILTSPQAKKNSALIDKEARYMHHDESVQHIRTPFSFSLSQQL
jgi:hypothetical protein